MLSDLFEGQRPQRESYIDELTQEMIEGRWRLSSDCLLLVKGKLANGQHRMAAVVKSGITCEFIVMESNDDELYKIIDCGRKRTVGDVISSVENYNVVASIAHWICKYDKGAISTATNSGSGKCCRGDVIEFAQKNETELVLCAKMVNDLYKKFKILPCAQAGALLFIGRRKNKTKSDQFINDFFTGDSRDDAAWDYREKCLKNRMSKAKMSPGIIFGLGIKSLKSYLNGTRNGNLKIADSEGFPKL